MPRQRKRAISLLGIFDKVNYKYLKGLCCAGIHWGRFPLKHEEEQVLLATADTATRIIKVNNILQHIETPAYFIESVILHEALHLVYTAHQAEYDGYIGKDPAHSHRFLSLESKFDITEKAAKWEEENLQDLLDEYKKRNIK